MVTERIQLSTGMTEIERKVFMDHGLQLLKRKLTTNPLCELLGSATCQRHQGFGEVD